MRFRFEDQPLSMRTGKVRDCSCRPQPAAKSDTVSDSPARRRPITHDQPQLNDDDDIEVNNLRLKEELQEQSTRSEQAFREHSRQQMAETNRRNREFWARRTP